MLASTAQPRVIIIGLETGGWERPHWYEARRLFAPGIRLLQSAPGESRRGSGHRTSSVLCGRTEVGALRGCRISREEEVT